MNELFSRSGEADGRANLIRSQGLILPESRMEGWDRDTRTWAIGVMRLKLVGGGDRMNKRAILLPH